MAKEDVMELEGVVEESMRNAVFQVMHNIQVLPGDHVTVEISPYDLTKGRIIWRSKG